MFSGIDHLDIAVDDPERMADYLVGLGFTIIRRTPENRGTIEIRFPGGPGQPFIELRGTTSPTGKAVPPGLRHMALKASDFEANYRTLKASGYQFTGEPKLVPDSGRTVVSLIDPEGNQLQIVSD